MNGPQIPLEKPTNPFAQALYLVIGALLLVGAIVMGAVIFAFAIGFILIVGTVIWLRLWWLRRKMRSDALRGDVGTSRDPSGAREVIEGEYTVIEIEDSARRSEEREPDR